MKKTKTYKKENFQKLTSWLEDVETVFDIEKIEVKKSKAWPYDFKLTVEFT